MKAGIYKIQSKIKPERVYIGSTVNVKQRIHEHLSLLRRSVHHNKKLQNHYNKYGEDDFIFSIIVGCERNELIEKEQFFIDSYNPFFNLRPKADNNLGVKYSDDVKRKMSVSRRGEGSYNYGRRGILCPNYGKKRSIEEIEKMRMRMMGEKNPMFGKTHTKDARAKISKRHKGKKISKEQIDLIRQITMKPILQYNKDGSFVKKWESASTASRELGIDNPTIVNTMRGKRESAGGFIWVYATEKAGS